MTPRSRSHIVTLLCVLFLTLAAGVVWLKRSWLQRGASPQMTAADYGYVGMRQCWVCHNDITASYSKTAMGRSFGVVTSETEIGDFSENNTHEWMPRGRHYEMTRQDDEWLMTSYSRNGSGAALRPRKDRITHWLGSGEHMRGYVTLEGSRQRLLHMAWYAPRGEWAAFAMRENGLPADEPLGYNCLYCHASYPRNAMGARWVAEVDHFPEPLELGPIDCERCHGPGKRHAQLASDLAEPQAIRQAIVNPARLATDLQMDVCAQCHLEPTTRFPTHRLVMPGKSPFSFRPGERLEDHFLVFDYDDPAMHGDGDTEIVNQSYLLVQSPCYQGSAGRMTCTTCHDPHRTPPRAERVAYFRAKCLTCHSAGDCTTPDIERAALATSDCVQCHMAPVYALDAVRALVHRHKIERRPVSNVDVPLEERLAHTERFFSTPPKDARLKLYFAHERLSADERRLWLALGHLRNSLADEPASQLADDMDRARVREPGSHLLLARWYLEHGQPEKARAQARQALDLVPRFAHASEALGEVELQLGRSRQAIELFRSVLSESPLHLRAQEGLVRAYVALKESQDANRESLKWQQMLDVYLDTDRPGRLGRLLSQTGRQKEAIAFYREALEVNADDIDSRTALDRLLRKFPELQ